MLNDDVFSSFILKSPTDINIIGKKIVIVISSIDSKKQFNDVVETIVSVKENIPLAKIVLIEINSDVCEYKEELEKIIDYFIPYYNIEESKENRDVQELGALKYFFKNLVGTDTEIVYKISIKHPFYFKDQVKLIFNSEGNYCIPKVFFNNIVSVLEKIQLYMLTTGSTIQSTFLLLPNY